MQDIYETPYGKVRINTDTDNMCISLSSGFDSALTFYIMALAASKHNPDVEIYSVTARRINSTDLTYFDRVDNYVNACKVTDWIRSEFPGLKIHDNILYDADMWWYCDDDPIVGKIHSYVVSQKIPGEYLKRKFRNNSRTHTFAYIGYNGTTKNPDFELAGFNPEKRRNFRDLTENPNDDESMINVEYFINDYAYEIEPFRNSDKRATFWLADHLGILDKLLKISRSCEGERELTNNWTEECHHCWWCYERTWAHENYKDPNAPVLEKYRSEEYFNSLKDNNADL